MATIKVSQEVYDELHRIMAIELEKKVNDNPKEAMKQIIKNRYGITFNVMISKMLNEYKEKHKLVIR